MHLAWLVWGQPATAKPLLPAPYKIVMVIEENRYFEDILGNSVDAPYINQLASGGAVLTQSFAVARPSQPNYFALFGGDTYGITTNSKPAQKFTAPNLGAALRAAGKTFIGYADGLPNKDFDGEVSGSYVRKHNPWVNWTNDASLDPHALPSAVNQPFTSFPSDLNALPDFSIVVPDDSHNMHDGTTRSGDAWLQTNLGAYATWAQTHNSLLIVTFDEGGFSRGDGRIPTLFFGPMVKRGAFADSIDHYDMLRTLLDVYNLAPFAHAATATALESIWRSPWQNATNPLDVDGNGVVRVRTAGDIGPGLDLPGQLAERRDALREGLRRQGHREGHGGAGRQIARVQRPRAQLDPGVAEIDAALLVAHGDLERAHLAPLVHEDPPAELLARAVARPGKLDLDRHGDTQRATSWCGSRASAACVRAVTRQAKDRHSPSWEKGASGGIAKRTCCAPSVAGTSRQSS